MKQSPHVENVSSPVSRKARGSVFSTVVLLERVQSDGKLDTFRLRSTLFGQVPMMLVHRQKETGSVGRD